MVKVTIEKDGKTITHTGDFYAGGVAAVSEDGLAARCSMIGNSSIDKIARLFKCMVPQIISKASDDPVVVAGTLLEFSNHIDEYIKKYIKEHADDIAAVIKKL